VAIFFGFAFVWTWAFYFPLPAAGHNPYERPWVILLILGGAGPSIAGVLMILLTYDQERRRSFRRRTLSLKRIGWRWWPVVLFLFPAILAFSIVVDLILGGPMPGMQQLEDLVVNPLMWPLVVFFSLTWGPWSEELGWRGYALDPLLERFGMLSRTVILGMIWAVWHLPFYFMPTTWHGQMGFEVPGFWSFSALGVAYSLVMTWVHRHTDRSILSAVLLHFTANFSAQVMAPTSNRAEVLRTILSLMVGIIGCVQVSREAG
jgi:membrane protease YdiL (CAAX protease family)